jgi:hypothetical protein
VADAHDEHDAFWRGGGRGHRKSWSARRQAVFGGFSSQLPTPNGLV